MEKQSWDGKFHGFVKFSHILSPSWELTAHETASKEKVKHLSRLPGRVRTVGSALTQHRAGPYDVQAND